MDKFKLIFATTEKEVDFKVPSCKIKDLLANEDQLYTEKLEDLDNKYADATAEMFKVQTEMANTEEYKHNELIFNSRKSQSALLKKNKEAEKFQSDYYLARIPIILDIKQLTNEQKTELANKDFWQNQDFEQIVLAVDFFTKRFTVKANG